MRMIEQFANGVTHYNFDNGLTVRVQIVTLNNETRIRCNTYRRRPSGKFISELIKDECENLTADALVDHLYQVSRRKMVWPSSTLLNQDKEK